MATVDHRYALRSLESGWGPVRDNPLVGTWKLVSCNAQRRNGQILPIYGANPDGRLFYDAVGNMSVHIMQAGRPNFKDAQKFRATQDEMRAAYLGYEAYFSTYDVNWEDGIINHHVKGGLFPNWTGSVQARFFQFDGPDRLILSTEPVGSTPKRRTIVTLVWERLS